VSVLDAVKAAKIIKQLPKSDFAQWYKTSKLVTDKGEPMLLYHGTSKDRDFKDINVNQNGAWFSSKPEDASQYAVENDSMGTKYERGKFVDTNTASRVIPSYVRAENIYKISEEDQKFLNSSPNYKKLQALMFNKLRAKGYDTVDFGGGTYAVIGDKKQIRSAILNKPTADETPRVESVPPKYAPGWYVDDATGEYHQIGPDGAPVQKPKTSHTPEAMEQYLIPPNSKGDKMIRDFFFDARKKEAFGKATYPAKDVISLFKDAFKDNNTPNSRFYYNLYDRLQNSTANVGTVKVMGNGQFISAGGRHNWAAAHHWGRKETYFPIRTLEQSKDDPSYLNMVMGHELVHGGTARVIDTNNLVAAELSQPLIRMISYATQEGLEKDSHIWYGLTSNKEFASEIYASPMFREAAKEAGVWYQTVTALAGILGISSLIQDSAARAEFEKLIEFDSASGAIADGST